MNNFVKKYENLSDNELASIAQGDDEAAVTLLSRYMPLIKSRASFYYNGIIDIEDLVQEGIIALYFSIKRFNSELSSFSTFARMCIDRGIISNLRSYALKKHIPQSKIVNLDDVEITAINDNPEELFIDFESAVALEGNIENMLSKLEYKVLMHYLHDFSIEEISKNLGITQKSVNNALCRVRIKLKSL